MAGILKNQLVKRLASFTKGLSVDKIDLDILNGRGYLDNLELDERFMTAVLELPNWMHFTKILCSKIKLQATFTKLKSEPIRIIIDTVYVEAEVSKRESDNVNYQQKLQEAGFSPNGPTSYGYIEQVIDGMQISVASIRITLTLQHHYLTVELNGVELVSTNSKWKADDLRKTRAYVMPSREEVLVYKMLTVSHAKIEFFDSNVTPTANNVPPLKFNLNTIHLLITMKKLVSTNEVVSARLKLLLDDMLMVLTPAQLQTLLAFSRELSQVIELSAPPAQPTSLSTNVSPPTRSQTPTKSSFLQRFTRQQEDDTGREGDDGSIDEVVSDEVLETSYHLKTGTIDILLCDDDCNSTGNGSLQYRFEAVQVELYPHRTANATRKHWTLPVQYVQEGQQWASEMLGDFIESSHRAGAAPLDGVYEMVVVMRCEHFQMLPVVGIKPRQILGPLLYSDKCQFGLTASDPAIFVTMVTYYSDREDIPIPAKSMHVHVNPTELNVDIATMWWIREFVASTMSDDFKRMLQELSAGSTQTEVKLKVVLLLPHVTIPLSSEDVTEEGRIKGVQLWFSKILLTNLNHAVYLPLLSFLYELYQDPAMEGCSSEEPRAFPSKDGDDWSLPPEMENIDLLPQILEELQRCEKLKRDLQEERARSRGRGATVSQGGGSGGSSPASSRRSSASSLGPAGALPSTSPFLNLPHLFPFIRPSTLGFHFDNFSADFIYSTPDSSNEKHRSRKFLSDVPLSLWLIDETERLEPPQLQNGHRLLTRNQLIAEPPSKYLALLKTDSSVHCTLDRDQYLFLMRLQQELQLFLERIILSVTQIFSVSTPQVETMASFRLLGHLPHVMLDVSLPAVPAPALYQPGSGPTTASTSLSQLTASSPSLSSRISTLDPKDIVSELEQRISMLSQSDANLSSLSERLSLCDEEGSVGDPAAGRSDNKETLLKFIMRVNRRREMVSVGCQTQPGVELVASNYQELHGVALAVEEGPRTVGGNLLQVHAGGVAVVVTSARDVTSKLHCRRVALLDEGWEGKARGCFPAHLTSPGEVKVRIVVRGGEDAAAPIQCEALVSNFAGNLKTSTLEGVSTFFGPDPTLPQSALASLSCYVTDSSLSLGLGPGVSQEVSIPRLAASLLPDERVVLGRHCCGVDTRAFECECEREIARLRKENEELREMLSGSQKPGG